MKKGFYVIIGVLFILLVSACSLTKDDLEGSTIYTTVYPVNYLTNYLFKDYATITSIYPEKSNINDYNLTEKQMKNFAKADLFIYNGLTNEKEIAKDLINKNHNLLIIDVSNGFALKNDSTELWLSPNNYLMLAKNIKNNLQEYLTSKYIIENIENNYRTFEEKISLMDAALYKLGSEEKNLIVVSNNTFKFLESYGFNVISLQDEKNLKENKLNTIKTNFKNKKYTNILVADMDASNEVVTDLIQNYNAKAVNIDTLSTTLKEDYFEIMTTFIENVKSCLC